MKLQKEPMVVQGNELQRERERASAAIGLGFTLCLANFKCMVLVYLYKKQLM
jgi:hypothetical protein